MELTEIELDALENKLAHPEKKVACPRCGSELQVKFLKTVAKVECSTPGCIAYTVRGI